MIKRAGRALRLLLAHATGETRSVGAGHKLRLLLAHAAGSLFDRYRRTVMKKHSENEKITRIEKRSIEIQAIAPVIEMVSKKIGKEEALELLKKVNQQEAFERGKSTVRTAGFSTIEELVKDVGTWGDGGEWNIEVLEETSRTYYFNVHRCLYYEKYKELGLEEIGVQFSCCRDEPFARGLDPNLKLSRTQTIMEGAGFCDFRYDIET